MAERVRQWFSVDHRSGERTVSWQARIFADAGAFLSDNDLDPTPDNYDLAFQYCAARNARLVAAVRAEFDMTGRISVDAADRILADHAAPVSAEALARLATGIEAQAAGLSGIARRSGADAAAFHAALVATTDPAVVFDLTRAMITRSRAAEAELRRSARELAGLRAHLAEAQRFADVDPLTELSNRRAFKRDLECAIVAARKSGAPLSVAFCDIDHFKALNDCHGHETGDRVLRFVAQRLLKHFGRSGIVGRFGGEEFIGAFPAFGVDRARQMVDACRLSLADLPLYAAKTGERIGAVTFSAGVAELHPGETIADLLRRADEAMYRAKNCGRNRVMLA